MTDKIYNLGIIGYGGMAGNHKKQLDQGNVRVRLKGVYDIDSARNQAAVEQGFIAYESREALLSDPDIEKISIPCISPDPAVTVVFPDPWRMRPPY